LPKAGGFYLSDYDEWILDPCYLSDDNVRPVAVNAGDPLQSPVHSVWGIPVIVTTAANDGDCFLVDTSKMGSILIREGISMHMGYTGFGLVENILTIVEEERFTLATVIPSAVQYITNLAVS
jgi:hypothetical protein